MVKQAATYTFIVARSRNHAIGCENRLPWRLPSDLRKFKELTIGRPVIMGRRTYESIGRPLPGRPNIVVSRENGIHAPGVCVVRSKADVMIKAQAEARKLGSSEIMIIGGAEIFELFQDEVTKVYLTEVDSIIERGDAYFHRDFSDWTVVSRQHVEAQPGDEFNYLLTVYERPYARKVQASNKADPVKVRQECFA